MLRYHVLRFAPVLACGLALAGPTSARAQHHHGGHAHHGHGHHGHGHHGHGHHGHGHGYGIGLSVGFGLGYGYGYRSPGYWPGYGGYYPSYAAYGAYPAYSPSYAAAYPEYSVANAAPMIRAVSAVGSDAAAPDPGVSGRVVSQRPVISARPADGPNGNGVAHAERPNGASIEVHVPEAEADVWVDSRETRARGRVRILVSPELVPGKAYVYRVLARWTRDGQQVAEERVAEVAAGKTTVVDFTQAAGPAGAAGPDDLPIPKERDPGKIPPAAK